MTDVNANINVNIDTKAALASLKTLQAEITSFNNSVIRSNSQAVAAQRGMLATLTSQIGASGHFSTSITNVESSISRLGTAIDKNKLSLGEYFRYGAASTKTFGRMFSREHNDIMGLATDRVKRLQTQYIALEKTQTGATRAMAIRPLSLFNADAAIAIQRQQLFNKLLHDGSTSLINFGKNTQWAGRQLMVGFSLPLAAFGFMAGKIFIDLDKQARDFKRVYGDIFTAPDEIERNLKSIQTLGMEYTKYGISLNDTMTIASQAAAAGMRNEQLTGNVKESLRLATIGQIDYKEALTTTITLQNAFKVSNTDLAPTVDFLGAIANQTVLTVQDLSDAIPRVAPVIKGLGGDVKDLAVMLVAMKAGGVSASQGANALKSGLASLINPTKAAVEMTDKFGINLKGIIKANKGDLMGTVETFGRALSKLDDFSRQQVLEKVFGKYQFARIGALFQNINDKTGQVAQAMDILGMSVEDLALLSDKSLNQISESTTAKFQSAVEKLKISIAPIGELFLKVATPMIEIVTKVLDKFNQLGPNFKKFIVILVAGMGIVVPAVIMLVGLFANFAGNIIKGISVLNTLFNRIRAGGSIFKYMSGEELDAAAAAKTLEGRTSRLTTALNIQREAVILLAGAYGTYIAAARRAAGTLPQGFRGGAARRMAIGGFVAGKGNKDTEPALLTPGEFVVNKKAAQENGPILSAMNSGGLIKYALGSENPLTRSDPSNGLTPEEVTPPEESTTTRRDSRRSGFTSSRLKSDVNVLRSYTSNVSAGGTGTGIHSGIGDIDPTSRADVASTFTRQIAAAAETNITAMQKQASDWTAANKVMLDELQVKMAEATRAISTTPIGVNQAALEEQDRLMREVNDKYIEDMTDATKPIGKFAAKAEDLFPEHSAELAETQRLIRDSGLNLTTATADTARAFYDQEEGTSLLKRMGEPAPFQGNARAMSAAVPLIEDYDYRRHGIATPFLDPKLRATGGQQSDVPGLGAEGRSALYRAGTSAEHVSKTPQQTEEMLTRNQNRVATAAAEVPAAAASAINIEQQSASDSKVTKKLGDEFVAGYVHAIQGGEDDAARASSGLGGAAIAGLEKSSKKTRGRAAPPGYTTSASGLLVPTVDVISRRPSEIMPNGGAPTPPTGPRSPMGFSEEDANNQEKRSKKIGGSLGRLSMKIGGVSMAATLAAGAFASMEGPIGEFASKMFPLLGVLDLVTIPLMFMGTGTPAAAGGVGAMGAAAAGATPEIAGLAAAETAAAAPLLPLIAVIALVVAAIAALAVAFKVTYDRFEPLREAVSSLIETLKVLGSEIFGDLIASFKQMFGITDKAGVSFGGFGDILQKIAGFLGPIFTVAIKMITTQFMYIGNAIRIVIKAFQIFFNIGKMVAGIVVGSIGWAFNWILEKLGPLGEGIRNFAAGFANVFVQIPQIISNVFSSVVGFIEDAINAAIDAINELIKLYEMLPEKLRPFTVTPIENIKLTIEAATAISGITDPLKDGAEGKDSNVKQGEATPTDLDPGPGGDGGKEKSFLETLIAEMSANEKLYLTAQGVSKKYILAKGNFFGVFQQLRGMGVSETIIDALGVGEEGVKAANELLGKGQKKIKEIVDRFAQANVLGPAVEAARKKIAGASNKRKAEGILDVSSTISFTDQEKKTLLGDENVIDAINAAAIAGKGPLKEYLGQIKEVLRVAKEPVDLLEQEINDLNLANQLQERSSEDQIRSYEEKIKLVNKEIEAIQKLNDADQGRIKTLDRQKEMIQRQIDALEKLNDADKKKAESLQRQDEIRNRTSDAISHELDLMTKSEQGIRELYDKRTKSLDQIEKANSRILQQQKDQLNISQALSSGDIYAATAAANELRQNQIQASQDNMKEGLQAGADNQVAALTTSNGLTRKQAEDQIAMIKEQSYQTSLLVRDVEDVIYQRNLEMVPLKNQQLEIDTKIRDINDQIYFREENIKTIQDERLLPLTKELGIQEDIKRVADDEFKRKVEDFKLLLTLASLTEDEADRVYNLAGQWKKVGEQIKQANELAKNRNAELTPLKPQDKYKTDRAYDKDVKRYDEQVLAIEKERAETIKKIETPYAGGMMPKYSRGNLVAGAGGRDSIPAMLTPGEFVMRKASVDKYGVPMLSSMNMGSFKMPDYGMGGGKGVNVDTKVTNKTSINAPMYNNYSVSVNVSGTNASADEIANRAVMKIKQMQNTAVRSGRGY